MDLHAIATAVNREPTSKTILIYGKAKTGKSTLAATVAKAKRIKTVHWFDNENGLEGLVTMVKKGQLTEEEAKKIIVYKIEDSVENPYAFETISKLIGLKRPMSICVPHGRVDCKDCIAKQQPMQVFDMRKCDSSTAIVIDSGSQYSDSIMHYYNDGKLVKGTAGMDAYREQGLRLVEFLTEVQGAKTNWIVITHDLVVELEAGSERIAAMDYKGQKIENTYPLIGTKPFSMKVGKYFAHVAYLEMKLGKHIGGSSTTYKAGTITGSRTGWRLEDQVTADKKPWLSLVPLFDQ